MKYRSLLQSREEINTKIETMVETVWFSEGLRNKLVTYVLGRY
jgi:hypothetical protein